MKNIRSKSNVKRILKNVLEQVFLIAGFGVKGQEPYLCHGFSFIGLGLISFIGLVR